MRYPTKKVAIEKLYHTIEAAIPRLSTEIECDEMKSHVERMYYHKLINLPRYLRWKQGIENARNIIIKGE